MAHYDDDEEIDCRTHGIQGKNSKGECVKCAEAAAAPQGSPSILKRMVSFPDAAGMALAALGHVRGVADRCTARYKDEPHVPGPQNPPIRCDLRAGHEGPHQHATCYGWIIMDREHLIELVPLPDVCQGCGTRWPCSIAEKVIKAFES